MTNREQAVSVWDAEPISSIIQRIHFKHTTKELRTLSVLSDQRSEGKTTVAMLLARGLNEVYGFKILLVDLNPEGDGLLNQYLNEFEVKQTNDGIVKGHPFNFSIFRLKNIDMNWLKNAYDGLYANQLVNSFSAQYDMVIVDTMTSENPGDGTFRANTQSNIIVSSKKSLGKGANKLQAELELNRKEVLGVVFNK